MIEVVEDSPNLSYFHPNKPNKPLDMLFFGQPGKQSVQSFDKSN
jgi:hypothetical protein